MRLLVTGSNGQLGRALRAALDAGGAPDAYAGYEADWVDLPELDISSMGSVGAWFDGHAPYDVVVNCAAFTNVDGCESDFAAAFSANALGPMNLARACAQCGATLVHVSTDYVFPGTEPGERAEDDVPAPISAYGRSKLAGEGLALAANPRTHVVRTAWLYGDGRNFVRTMLGLAGRFDEVTVVSDQLGNPTSAADLAHEILRIALSDSYGVWHCTNEGICSWADLAQAAFELSGSPCTVRRCTSAEWKRMNPQSADRPAYSALRNGHLEATIGNQMRPWREALADYLAAQ
ncbi:MAG: dTDP-4-dehydrorhamnose reductase [Coriobacteriaceae bacterium]|jgi:dTDP-4-dehydrorhamnose reductase|nr:dTDP-4-dehydrorhamnose reductase [Coriobacteriaceae bacterium]